MEDSNVTDTATGRKIRVSVTVRKLYREIEEYQGLRNARLNQVIAADFSRESSNILHHFRLTKSGKNEIGEIRGSADIYFVSAIRDNYIDILTVQGKWFQPKYRILDSKKLRLED
jgi:hypothetical protein